jgi:hypothetical protein
VKFTIYIIFVQSLCAYGYVQNYGMVVSALEAYKKKVSMVERCNLWLVKGNQDLVFRWKMMINDGICKSSSVFQALAS